MKTVVFSLALAFHFCNLAMASSSDPCQGIPGVATNHWTIDINFKDEAIGASVQDYLHLLFTGGFMVDQILSVDGKPDSRLMVIFDPTYWGSDTGRANQVKSDVLASFTQIPKVQVACISIAEAQ